MLDLPGGFIEKHERAEQGLQRELSEELGLNLKDVGHYLCNFTNVYRYENIEYYTLDLYFLLSLDKKPDIIPADDVAAYEWFKADLIDDQNIGFDSVKNALTYYREHIEPIRSKLGK